MGLRVVRRELHRLVGELRREVGEVPLALEPRPVRRRDLLLLELKERHTGGTDFNFDTQIMENTASYHILIKSKTLGVDCLPIDPTKFLAFDPFRTPRSYKKAAKTPSLGCVIRLWTRRE